MSETQSYASTLESPGDTAFSDLGRFGTTSPSDELRERIAHCVRQGWTPVVEHIESDRRGEHYWDMWRLPMFGQRDVNHILREFSQCRSAYPNHAVRVIGWDHTSRRMLGGRIVVHHHNHEQEH